jgi:hypothetical protein
MSIDGTGDGLAQDATLQQILLALGGGPIPQGGTGMGLAQDATLQLILLAISGGGGGAKTAATVVSGETYDCLSTDTAIRFDTTGGTTATAVLPSPIYIGQQITFYWWAWSGAQVVPTINTSAGKSLVPFSGQASSGAAGLAATTTISTPGASFVLEWNGTEWMAA